MVLNIILGVALVLAVVTALQQRQRAEDLQSAMDDQRVHITNLHTVIRTCEVERDAIRKKHDDALAALEKAGAEVHVNPGRPMRK